MDLILFGETHGLLDELPKVEEIIQNFKPEIILYELLEETELKNGEMIDEFLTNNPEDEFSIISKYKDLFPTIKLAKKYNLPIVGCDIKNMLRKDKSFLELEPTKENLANEEKIMQEREKKQYSVIKKNSGKKTLVLVGAYHLRKESILRTLNAKVLIPRINGKELDEVEDFNGKLTYVEEQVGQSSRL